MDGGSNEGSSGEAQVVHEFNPTAEGIATVPHQDKEDSSDSEAEDTGTSSSETPSKGDGYHTPGLEIEDDLGKQERLATQHIAHLSDQLRDLIAAQSADCQTKDPQEELPNRTTAEAEDHLTTAANVELGKELDEEHYQEPLRRSTHDGPTNCSIDDPSEQSAKQNAGLGIEDLISEQSSQRILEMLAGPPVLESTDASHVSETPFPFLRLPYDIRKKVYDEVLSCSPGCIEPDVTKEYWRHGNLDNAGSLDLDLGGLALLLTCKQISLEACEVLYGGNIFHFNDRGYLSAFQGCINASGCRGSDHIQTSSVTGMYLFLRLIGRVNRMRLRFIEIELTRPQSCYYPQEINEEMEFFTSWDMPVGGHYLGKAIDLLAQAHKLSVLRIRLNDKTWTPEWYRPRLTMWMHFFRDPAESQLIRHLQKINGLAMFRCDPEEAYRSMVDRKENIQEGRRREDHIQQLKMTLEKEYVIALESYSSLEIKMMGRSSFKHRDKVLSLAEELDTVQSEKRAMWTELMDGIESAEKIAVEIVHTVEKETSEKIQQLRQKARTNRTELDDRAGRIALEMKRLLSNDTSAAEWKHKG